MIFYKNFFCILPFSGKISPPGISIPAIKQIKYYLSGQVNFSSSSRYSIASFREERHISREGLREAHTLGLAGSWKILQRIFSSR